MLCGLLGLAEPLLDTRDLDELLPDLGKFSRQRLEFRPRLVEFALEPLVGQFQVAHVRLQLVDLGLTVLGQFADLVDADVVVVGVTRLRIREVALEVGVASQQVEHQPHVDRRMAIVPLLVGRIAQEREKVVAPFWGVGLGGAFRLVEVRTADAKLFSYQQLDFVDVALRQRHMRANAAILQQCQQKVQFIDVRRLPVGCLIERGSDGSPQFWTCLLPHAGYLAGSLAEFR